MDFGLHIHGEEVGSTSEETFPKVNPATGTVIATVHQASTVDHYTQRKTVYVETGDVDAPY